MRFQSTGNQPGDFIVRLERGEEVIESLTAFMQAQGIGFAYLGAIGAVSGAEIGWWNAASGEYEFHQYTEQMEVLSAHGTCSIMDGKSFLHLHAMLGRADMSVVGGHLKGATVNPLLEVWVHRQEATVLRAQEGPFTGFQLPEKFG